MKNHLGPFEKHQAAQKTEDCVPSKVHWSHEVLHREPRAAKESPLKEWWLAEQRAKGICHLNEFPRPKRNDHTLDVVLDGKK